MAIFIYNTLTRKKEEFIPLKPGFVNFYGCGPTVYNYFHIGNARTFMMYDVIRRYLEFRGYRVNFVVNITDIDDRIIEQANQEKSSFTEVSEKYFTAYQEDQQKFGIRSADIQPRATGHVKEIIALIEQLILKGYAYQANGDVYFHVTQFPNYGKLSGKKIDELKPGAGVEGKDIKKDPLDFALWKSAKPGEPSWESSWGPGRPGWHIECSAMSMKYLGETFDIHAGAHDLIFPHHENEIAQSESATGKSFVRYWIHLGFLNFEGEKMSKSLGNFYTLREILKKVHPGVLRLFYLQSHYRASVDFTMEALEGAEKGHKRIKNTMDELIEKLKNAETDAPGNTSFGLKQVQECKENFIQAMDDDFNTPQALAHLFEFTRQLNIYLNSGNKLEKKVLEASRNLYQELAYQIFGVIPLTGVGSATISFQSMATGSVISPDEIREIESKIELRNQHRKNREWQKADKIRKEVEEKFHIILKDTAEGTTWKPL